MRNQRNIIEWLRNSVELCNTYWHEWNITQPKAHKGIIYRMINRVS